jgi:hypothetical protein
MNKTLIVGFKNVENGWILENLGGENGILDQLYGVKYNESPIEKLIFFRDQDLTKAIEHVRKIAIELNFEVSEESNNTLLVKSTQFSEKPLDFEIDLKWSLWSTDESLWKESCKEENQDILTIMRNAFNGTDKRIVIHSAPRREIRFGQVELSKGKAKVEFSAVWDTSFDLVPDNCPKRLRKNLIEEIEFYFEDNFYDDQNPLGALVSTVVESDSFDDLMFKIDGLEDKLIEDEKENSKKFHEWLNDIIPYLKKL